MTPGFYRVVFKKSVDWCRSAENRDFLKSFIFFPNKLNFFCPPKKKKKKFRKYRHDSTFFKISL